MHGATPQGALLLVGLRNPVPGGRALLVPLVNSRQVGGGERAQFGAPMRRSLDCNGIRSIDDDAASASHPIVAGPPADGRPFHLDRWNADARDKPLRIEHADLSKLHPEALEIDDRPRPGAQVLSDDDGVRRIEMRWTDRPAADRRFRATALTP